MWSTTSLALIILLAAFFLALPRVGVLGSAAFVVFIPILFFPIEILLSPAGGVVAGIVLKMRGVRDASDLKAYLGQTLLRESVTSVVVGGLALWAGLWLLRMTHATSLAGILLGAMAMLSILSHLDKYAHRMARSTWALLFRVAVLVAVFALY